MFTTQLKRVASKSVSKLGLMKGKMPVGQLMTFANLNRQTGFRASMALNKPMSYDNFVNGTSAVYVDQLYDQWKENPKSVHASWQAYFKNMDLEAAEPYMQPPTVGHGTAELDIIMSALKEKTYGGESIQSIGSETVEQAQSDAFKVMSLIRAFMTHGHLAADLDPLKLQETYGEDSSS